MASDATGRSRPRTPHDQSGHDEPGAQDAPAVTGGAEGDPRAALEMSSEGFAVFDAAERLVFVNGRTRTFFPELAKELVPGVRLETLLRAYLAADPNAPSEPGEVEEWVRHRLARHRRPDQPFTFRTIQGRWLLTSERALPDGSTVTVHTDVTALKEKEERLRASEAEAQAARREAERANRAKTEFLAQMSHELRTPLNAVMGFAELMMNETLGPLGNPRYRDYAQDIVEGGKHLLDLINDILDLSRIEAGRMELIEEATSVVEAVEYAARLVREQAIERGVRMDLDAPSSLPALRADARALRQMIINLASNAVKFTPADGHVLISASELPDGGIGIMVADTGIGIAPEDLERVLEPFARAEGAYSRETEGTGLGLPIVKRLVELHGGRLELTSEPGQGTTAILLFPPERSLPAGPPSPMPWLIAR